MCRCRSATTTSHYSFGGLRIAVKRGSALYHLHGDHLGSTSLTTAGSAVEASRAYYAYGSERSASGDLQTDRTFTGQKRDATGLMYYNARYYDPALGTFISPDSLVPNPASVINYNRFLYARGNPLKYSDPTGYSSHEKQCSTQECWEEEWHWKNRWYEAHGYGWGDGHWDQDLPIAKFSDFEILTDVLTEAGITLKGTWEFDNLSLLGQGVVQFAKSIAASALPEPVGISVGIAHLKELIGGPIYWYRQKVGSNVVCFFSGACSLEPGGIGFYDNLFDPARYLQLPTGGLDVDNYESYIRGVAVHELAHYVGDNLNLDLENMQLGTRHITDRGNYSELEYWAEMVTDWVYGSNYVQLYISHPYYKEKEKGRQHIDGTQLDIILGVFRP